MSDSLTDGELTVLGLLMEQPRHGYDLERVIEERGIRTWTALGFSSIYYVLDKLAKRGLIEAAGAASSAKARVTYRVTGQGREMCAAATRAALAELAPVRARVLIAMANSDAIPDADVATGLNTRLDALREQLAAVHTMRSRQEPLPRAAAAIFDYCEAMLQADDKWARSTLGEFETEGTVDKYDIKKVLKELYASPSKEFTVIDVPDLQYIAVDGRGDPNTSSDYSEAVQALYGVAYTLKFTSKKTLGKDFVVGPLEGLWRADDPDVFVARRKDEWEWTMLISLPDWITEEMVHTATDEVTKKKGGPAAGRVRLLTLSEGTCVQILHVGPYDDEAPVLDRLHHQYLPEHGLTFNGDHHEIYLSDPRRTEPAKLKTILRQPVRGRS